MGGLTMTTSLNWSLILFFVVIFTLHKTTSESDNDLDLHSSSSSESHPLLEALKSKSKGFLERVKRRAVVKTDSSHASGLSNVATQETFMQNVAVALGVTVVFCITSFTLVMCIFCNDDDKGSEVGGANGYVGEINLADIQVIYNLSAGASPLPYTHHNEAFRGSQEDIILANPAVLQVTSCEGVTVQPSNSLQNPQIRHNPRLVSGEGNVSKQSRRLKDVYVERENTIQLEYENFNTGFKHDSFDKQTDRYNRKKEVGKENNAPSLAVQNKSIPRLKRSDEYFDNGKEYDMNDLTIKNMHVRY